MKEKNVREIIFPQRIVTSSNISHAGWLQREKPLQISFQSEGLVRAEGKGRLILDFGQELCGGIRILINQVRNGRHITAARVIFGESLGEVCAEPGDRNSIDAHSVRIFEGVKLLSMSDTMVGNTGFRFVRIDFLEDAAIDIEAIAAVCIHSGAKIQGKFISDDTVLNQIYETAARTIYLNLQNGFIWDGIKRDRLVWVGDLHPEICAALPLVGSVENIRNSLRFVRETTAEKEWCNHIPSYSLWYIYCLYEYWLYTGDADAIHENVQMILSITNRFESCIESDGTLAIGTDEKVSMPYFIDWNTFGDPRAEEGMRYLLEGAFRRAEEMLRSIGCGGGRTDSLRAKLRLPPITSAQPKPMIALGALVDAPGKDGAAALLKSGGTDGFSSFMSFYIVSAVAEAGESEAALALMRSYFAAMLEKGATTFWEDFDLSWAEGSSSIDELPQEGKKDIHGDFGKHCYRGYRHSLCHGWASWPVAFLTKYIAGVHIVQSGCRTIELRPNLGSLKKLDFSCATPFGTMTLRYRKKGDKLWLRYRVPKEIRLIIDKNICAEQI